MRTYPRGRVWDSFPCNVGYLLGRKSSRKIIAMIKISLTRNTVINACIKYDWYTRGTNSDYAEMLDYVQAVFGVYGDTYVNIATAETAIKKWCLTLSRIRTLSASRRKRVARMTKFIEILNSCCSTMQQRINSANRTISARGNPCHVLAGSHKTIDRG